MSWYYAEGDERKGPVEEAEFRELVANGVIGKDTLVWQNGMAEWKAYRLVAGKVAGNEGLVACDACGKSFEANDLISLDGRRICGDCKPLVVQRMQEGSGSSYDEIRNVHLKHEASIRSVGFLYMLGGVGAGFVGLGLTLTGEEGIWVGLFLLAFAAFQLWTAINLRKLKPMAKVGTGILSGLGLLGFPLGTLINGYILYLVFSQKGRYIMSDEYAEVREKTPHIKYRTSVIVIILLVLLLAMMGFGLLAAFFRSVPR